MAREREKVQSSVRGGILSGSPGLSTTVATAVKGGLMAYEVGYQKDLLHIWMDARAIFQCKNSLPLAAMETDQRVSEASLGI